MLAYPKFFHVLAAKNRVASGLPLFRSSLIVSSRFFSYASSIHAEALRELSDADVEACPLVISYESVSGGAQPRNKEGHMRNQQEHVLVIHRRGDSP